MDFSPAASESVYKDNVGHDDYVGRTDQRFEMKLLFYCSTSATHDYLRGNTGNHHCFAPRVPRQEYCGSKIKPSSGGL